MDIASLYDQKRIEADAAADYLNDDQNLILGMSVAMPPALIKGVASALQQGQLNKLNLYYMHGSQVLCDNLLTPELADKVCPRPLFMSGHDREALTPEATFVTGVCTLNVPPGGPTADRNH